VSNNSPIDVRVLQLLDTQLPREGTIGLVVHILGGHPNLGGGEMAYEEEVQRWRGNDKFSRGIELGFVEMGDDRGDGIYK
jgi:hypothetical protein